MTAEANPFLGFEGRISRATYWVCFAILVSSMLSLFVIGFIAVAIISAVTNGGHEINAMLQRNTLVLTLIVILGLAYPMLTSATKRLHDIGLSGWWSLVLVVPPAIVVVLALLGVIAVDSQAAQFVDKTLAMFQLLIVVVLGCMPGSGGPNAYGDSPVSAQDRTGGALA